MTRHYHETEGGPRYGIPLFLTMLALLGLIICLVYQKRQIVRLDKEIKACNQVAWEMIQLAARKGMIQDVQQKWVPKVGDTVMCRYFAWEHPEISRPVKVKEVMAGGESGTLVYTREVGEWLDLSFFSPCDQPKVVPEVQPKSEIIYPERMKELPPKRYHQLTDEELKRAS